ncbi:MAG: hypothetical protein ACW972_03235 [Promethearchaeota archaeon]|jgi:hypothetical protein
MDQTAKIVRITVLPGALSGGGNIISIYAAMQIKRNRPSKNLDHGVISMS